MSCPAFRKSVGKCEANRIFQLQKPHVKAEKVAIAVTEIAAHFTIVPFPCGEELCPIEQSRAVCAMVEFVAQMALFPEHGAW
jgi:hypothetical protein